jgi:hypothetical protein
MVMMGEHGDGNGRWIETSQWHHSFYVKQHGSNVGCLLGFLAIHDYFSLIFLHMHDTLQNFVILLEKFHKKRKGWCKPTFGDDFD